jgi:redox-sensitive bicupin YhaK (pirin superfamily)
MEKVITATYGGANAKVGDLLVNRLLPNRYMTAVGPFIFLDHIYPVQRAPKKVQAPNGDFAHPHRGIVTFTYLFSGSLEHFDSKGNHGIVNAGGAQWMNAGNGIIHDEHESPEFQATGGTLHGLQFWINLPAAIKEQEGGYLALQPEAIPELELPEAAGVLRVVIGSYGDHVSPVKTFTRQFMYHIKLNPKGSYTLDTKAGLEYAVFVPADGKVNGQQVANSEVAMFEDSDGSITLSNCGITGQDVIIFGGEPYTEPIFAEGPFVMGNRLEVAHAYRDFFNGDYGSIDYHHASTEEKTA